MKFALLRSLATTFLTRSPFAGAGYRKVLEPASEPSPSMYTIRLIAGITMAASVNGACSVDPRDAPPNLVLITVDTWRADHFLSDRAGRALTPRLEEFAARALRFPDATSVGCETSPGLAGIITGLLPHRSGVIINSHLLTAGIPTLATRLRAAGYATAAWVANPVVRPGMGFDQGFDDYEYVRAAKGDVKPRAALVSGRAWEWIEKRPPAQPFFAWIHYMEPHGPYSPVQETRALFPNEAFGSRQQVDLLPKGNDTGRGGIPYYQWHPTRETSGDCREYQARYAAEVHDLDRALGNLLERLETAGLLDNSVLVLTADHGEALRDDHGYYFSHGHGLTQDQLHVPLLLYYPDCQAGSVINRPVSTIDILPTVLALLNQPSSPDLDGRHLLEEGARIVGSESGTQTAVRDGPWKLQWRKSTGTPLRLVDLAKEPAERIDLLQIEAERASLLGARLRGLRSRPALAEPINRFSVSEEQARQLEALGYTGSE